jgi:hypothetical protein
MKRRISVLILALCLLLAGCSSMLDRQFNPPVQAHNQFPAADTDSSALRAETYTELVNAVFYLVSQGQKKGVVKLYNYTRDVASDLAAACLEVAREDPLGTYAVDYIKHDYTRVLNYYEATITIGYRRTPEQIASIVPVTGSSAIRGEVQNALDNFSPEVVLRVSYFTEDANYIGSLIRQAYYDTPAAAFGMPDYTVSLYPDTGTQRIVEVTLTYPDDPAVLRQKSAQLKQQARDLLSSLLSTSTGDTRLAGILTALRARSNQLFAAAGGASLSSSPYAALVSGAADSEGRALALTLLYNMAGAECNVVSGTLNGQSHFWVIVVTSAGPRHADPAMADGLFRGDQTMEAAGYAWNASDYPACVETSPTP